MAAAAMGIGAVDMDTGAATREATDTGVVMLLVRGSEAVAVLEDTQAATRVDAAGEAEGRTWVADVECRV
jgi:hypothetical protein